MKNRIIIRQSSESIQVHASDGRVICYLYFDDWDEGRRVRQGRWTRAEAIQWGQKIARALSGPAALTMGCSVQEKSGES